LAAPREPCSCAGQRCCRGRSAGRSSCPAGQPGVEQLVLDALPGRRVQLGRPALLDHDQGKPLGSGDRADQLPRRGGGQRLGQRAAAVLAEQQVTDHRQAVLAGDFLQAAALVTDLAGELPRQVIAARCNRGRAPGPPASPVRWVDDHITARTFSGERRRENVGGLELGVNNLKQDLEKAISMPTAERMPLAPQAATSSTKSLPTAAGLAQLFGNPVDVLTGRSKPPTFSLLRSPEKDGGPRWNDHHQQREPRHD
jgi:hypothetical protein